MFELKYFIPCTVSSWGICEATLNSVYAGTMGGLMSRGY